MQWQLNLVGTIKLMKNFNITTFTSIKPKIYTKEQMLNISNPELPI